MDAQPPKTLLKLRTFAQDVEKARQKSGAVLPENVKTSEPVETPKLGAVRSSDTAPTPTPVVTAVDSPTPSEHIPAYHELHKKSSPAAIAHKGPDITVAPEPKKVTPAPKRTISVRTKKPDLKATKSASGGTVITDSKAEGFKLLPSILKSIDSWIRDIKKSFKKKPAPKYVITDTERRRGVIQKATSKTGSIFTADNETLKEQIRRRQQSAPEVASTDISWSPNTEPGYPLLAGDAPKAVTSNVSVAFKKQSTPTIVTVPIPVAEVVVPPPPPPPPPVVTVAPIIIEPPVTVVAEPLPPPTPAPAVEEVVVVLEQEPEEPEVVKENYELTTPEAHYKIRSLGDISRVNTNLLSIVIIGAIAGLIIFIVIVRALLGFIIPSGPSVSIEPLIPLAETTVAIDVTVEPIGRESVLSAIDSGEAESLTELRFVNEAGIPISAASLLPLFGFTNHPNLNRSIIETHVVARGQERAIIFNTTDTTTVLGSLLSWERSMLSDLATVLEISTVDSLGEFSDTKVGTIDVRVYVTNEGSEKLVYGFINENTVVISTNSALFNAFLPTN